MTKKIVYNKKIVILSALVAALAIIYVLTFVLDPANRRGTAFAWLDPSSFDMADRIEIYGINGNTELVRRNNVWFFSAATAEYPVKQGRVEDLFAALSRKEPYPQRASSQEARERLGLTEDSASRIIIRGGAGLPLLDLLIGRAAAVGSEIYLRRGSWNEIYSGEDRFTVFTDSSPISWCDLRLFLNDESGLAPYTIDAVQQADVKPLDGDAYVLRRRGAGWIIQGDEGAVLDTTKVDGWLRAVLEAEGDTFSGGDISFAEASVTLWLGDGTSRTIQVSGPDADNSRKAAVSGSPYVYLLAEWNFNRLFRESSYFLRE
ncbi:MAG: DUF4340 domain-containing protein [Treponema sp.]|jgi:hypothetical protein|nr:DUF4340 domain-containing protein [Treponema sp.]